MDQILFPPGINNVLEKHTIPRILRPNEELNLYRKYYFPEFDQKFKCTRIDTVEGFIFYYLSNELYQYVLSFPIGYECYTFTLDKYNIMSREIVNDEHIYRGYQIKWWLYKHNTKKYRHFFELFDSIEDDNIYAITGILQNSKYVDCRISLKYRRGD